MNEDEQHLRLLSIFHYVCAGLAALFSCFPIFHLVFGLLMVFAPGAFGESKNPPPRWFGMFFVAFASAFILAGFAFATLIFLAGRSLARHKRYTFCLVIACIACLFMPFGTILGVFTIIVLMRPSVKTLFGVASPKPIAQ